MNDTWLILDCNFLCYRALWGIGELSYNGIQTGVAFGFLSDMLGFQTRFGAQHVIFCFDSKQSKRKKLYPQYKANRHKPDKNATPEEIEEQKLHQLEFYKQVYYLRETILPDLGYGTKTMMTPGYEADDWVSQACNILARDYPYDTKIIISGDYDLLQCLNSTTELYDPTRKKRHTNQSFYKKYGISPGLWPKVKAIAGCQSDNIQGIPSVGEKTAIKYLKFMLARKYKSYKNITSPKGVETIKQNYILTKLPFENGLPDYYFNKEQPDNGKWRQVTKSLGMTMLINAKPQVRKRKGVI